jgi:hypothetical protein
MGIVTPKKAAYGKASRQSGVIWRPNPVLVETAARKAAN